MPLVVALVDGQRYLVSMLGEGAQWVRNVRAAGLEALLTPAQLSYIRSAPAAGRPWDDLPGPTPPARLIDLAGPGT